jgi:hypothetical protein
MNSYDWFQVWLLFGAMVMAFGSRERRLVWGAFAGVMAILALNSVPANACGDLTQSDPIIDQVSRIHIP